MKPTMRCAIASVAMLALSQPAWAKPGKPRKPDAEIDVRDDDGDDRSDKKTPKTGKTADDGGRAESPDASATAEKRDDVDRTVKTQEPAEPFVKQDLTGHDLNSTGKGNEFERDRFFADKIDSAATENGTLIQGNLSSSSLLYTERGGNYPAATAAGSTPGSNSAAYSRLFTDLRLQTDFRHIAGSRWEARIDARARFVNSPTAPTEPLPGAPNGHIQSGLTGQNEYEVRELWLIRSGERTDFILGRQFVPDLGGVKIDGMRFDYASSSRLTFLGFAGLYPLRGSRSITTDYIELKNPSDPTISAGRFVGAGGFGAAYRTPNAYGSFGAVALVPLQREQPRVFATTTGYWRPSQNLDFYHFALIDAVSSYGAQITNLSAGLNYKPAQRLRLTTSFHHVDTDSLNIQAAAFYDSPQPIPVVQNEIALQRLSTTTARGSISAGLGHLQRFELTVAMALRYRPSFTLTTFAATGAGTAVQLDAAKSVEVYGSAVDRRSIFGTRIGVDAMQTFGIGGIAFQRSEVLAVRGFLGRSLGDGRGEWETEFSYATTKDSGPAMPCGTVPTCFGQSSTKVMSGGGTLYYRLNRDWLVIGQAFVSHTVMTSGMLAADPAIFGLTGYLRIAYRF